MEDADLCIHLRGSALGSVYAVRVSAHTDDNQGFPLSFGVFQNYLSQLPQFSDDPFISVIGTTASGISYMGAPIIIPIIKRYTKYRQRMIWIGCESKYLPKLSS